MPYPFVNFSLCRVLRSSPRLLSNSPAPPPLPPSNILMRNGENKRGKRSFKLVSIRSFLSAFPCLLGEEGTISVRICSLPPPSPCIKGCCGSVRQFLSCNNIALSISSGRSLPWQEFLSKERVKEGQSRSFEKFYAINFPLWTVNVKKIKLWAKFPEKYLWQSIINLIPIHMRLSKMKTVQDRILKSYTRTYIGTSARNRK